MTWKLPLTKDIKKAGNRRYWKVFKLKSEEASDMSGFFLFVVWPVATSRFALRFKLQILDFHITSSSGKCFSCHANKVRLLGFYEHAVVRLSLKLTHPVTSLSDGSIKNFQICDVVGASCPARSAEPNSSSHPHVMCRTIFHVSQLKECHLKTKNPPLCLFRVCEHS